MKFSSCELTICGRVTKDPEVMTSKGGKDYVRLSVVWDKSWKKADGTWQKTPNFVDVMFFNWDVKNIGERVRKGDFAVVWATVETKNYKDQDTGKWVNETNIIGSDFLPVPKGARVNADGTLADAVGSIQDEFDAIDFGGDDIPY
jgi:single stranded DNA-binding protein